MAKPLLEAKNIYKKYGLQLVLDDLSFQVSEGSKIALIGRNGAGKSTLLKILLGDIEMDRGSVNIFEWTRVGVIHQNEVLPNDRSTLTYLEEKSAKPSWEVKKMGSKFGLHEDHMSKAPAELSGGYQMRIKLVVMFLDEPNLLFLDEPVNYLDLQTLLLLEAVLADYRGSFIVVAHDMTFLQNTCDSVFEIERGVLTTYKGRVQEYLDWKAEQMEYAKRMNKKLSKEIQHNQKFVDRFSAKASLASRAQNKAKHITKLRSKIMKINADLATTRIKIASPQVHSGLAMRTQDLAIGYGENVIAKNISFDIMRGEKVVIAGENGRGKSTLLKTLIHKIEPIEGSVKWWKHADIGYYDQMTSSSLNDRDTVITHLTSCAPSTTPAEQILMMAGNFLFKGDDLDKRVTVLSGGERARLALAGVLLRTHNMLILDEPTNHMDVQTAEGLALALKSYTGTIIFVSHARTFVSALVDRILEVRNGSVREYNGSYDDYVEDLAELMESESMLDDQQAVKDRTKRLENNAERLERNTRLRELSRSIKKIDLKISELEKEKSKILKFFFDNPTDYAPEKAQRLAELGDELAHLEQDWLKFSEDVERLRK